jgi:hypothetical protein
MEELKSDVSLIFYSERGRASFEDKISLKGLHQYPATCKKNCLTFQMAN